MKRPCLNVVAMVWAGLLMIAFSSHAWGRVCVTPLVCKTSSTPVRVVVRFDAAKPYIDRSRSRQWIRRKARERDTRRHPVGLTEVRLTHRMSTQFETCSDTVRRKHCVYLTEVSLVLGYEDTKVYIAREYPPGRCEYQAIYQHEANHVRILNAHQQRFLGLFRKDLRRLVRRLKPHLSRNAQKERKRIIRQLEREVRQRMRRLEKSLKAAHAAIDTDQNYADVQAGCGQW